MVRRVPAPDVADGLGAARALDLQCDLPGDTTSSAPHGRQDLLQRAAPDVADGLGAARALALHGEAAAPAGRVPILALESRQRKY